MRVPRVPELPVVWSVLVRVALWLVGKHRSTSSDVW